MLCAMVVSFAPRFRPIAADRRTHPDVQREQNAKPNERKKKPRARLRRAAVITLRVVVLSYLGAAAVLYFLQSHFVYFPSGSITAAPDSLGMDYEEVTFHAADGTKLSAWYVPTANAEMVILFCHGNAGNISGRLEAVRVCRSWGASVLIFDYRGYGRSEGSPSEEGTYADARAAWNYLVGERKVPADRIVILGRSLGGAVAARLAKEHTPRALILESTFTSFRDIAADVAPIFPTRWLSRFDYDTESIIGGIGCPVLIVHSRQDRLIPFSHGERLFQAAGEPKQFLRITGRHNDGFFTSGRAYTDGVKTFLEERVFAQTHPADTR